MSKECAGSEQMIQMADAVLDVVTNDSTLNCRRRA